MDAVHEHAGELPHRLGSAISSGGFAVPFKSCWPATQPARRPRLWDFRGPRDAGVLPVLGEPGVRPLQAGAVAPEAFFEAEEQHLVAATPLAELRSGDLGRHKVEAPKRQEIVGRHGLG